MDTKILQGFKNQQHKLLEKQLIKDSEIQCESLRLRKSWGWEGVLEKYHHLPALPFYSSLSICCWPLSGYTFSLGQHSCYSIPVCSEAQCGELGWVMQPTFASSKIISNLPVVSVATVLAHLTDNLFPCWAYPPQSQSLITVLDRQSQSLDMKEDGCEDTVLCQSRLSPCSSAVGVLYPQYTSWPFLPQLDQHLGWGLQNEQPPSAVTNVSVPEDISTFIKFGITGDFSGFVVQYNMAHSLRLASCCSVAPCWASNV